MATVICFVPDCKHRSKRPLKKWRLKSGERCYGCTLEVTAVAETFDPDGDIHAVGGPDVHTHCANYEPEEGTELPAEEADHG